MNPNPAYELLITANTKDDLEEVSILLGNHSIPFKVEKAPAAFDVSFAFNTRVGELQVMVFPEDLQPARQILEEAGWIEPEEESLDEEDYFKDFSVEELQDVLVRPEEWGEVQVANARKILQERGEEIDVDKIHAARQAFVVEVRQSKKASFVLLMFTFLLTVGGGLVGLVMALMIALGKGKDPEGGRYYYYDQPSRFTAWLIVGIATLWIVVLLYLYGYVDFGVDVF